jgi:ATPase subunit of ABC transporter with duplicated ATPase domains
MIIVSLDDVTFGYGARTVLDAFEGTVLVVCHDRYFLDRVVERIVELEEGALVEYPGDYSYYREHGQDQ